MNLTNQFIHNQFLPPQNQRHTKGLFVLKERKWKDSKEDGKFLENCVSSVWNPVREERKVAFLWDPYTKTFPSNNVEKV